MNFPEEWVKHSVIAVSQQSFLASSDFLITEWTQTLQDCGVSSSESKKAAESQAFALRRLFCRVNNAPERFGGIGQMSDNEKMRFFSNSAHYPKDVADLLSIPAAPAAERKKALKKIGRFMQAATKGRNWAKKEIPAWEKASLYSWCSVIEDVGYPLCLWTAGSIVRRFHLCDQKITLARVKNRLLTYWRLYQPNGLRYVR